VPIPNLFKLLRRFELEFILWSFGME
jgi:hypothetical protein